MKKLFIFLILSVVFVSCEQKQYKYRIEGYVKNPTEWDKYKGYHTATAYTDTFQFNKDSVWYFNSNGSKVTFVKPYKIIKNECGCRSKEEDDGGMTIIPVGDGVIIF